MQKLQIMTTLLGNYQEDISLFFSATSKQYKSLLSKDMLDAMIQISAQQTQGDKITDDNNGLPFVVSVLSDLLAGRWQLVFGANISNCPATRAMLDISEGSILLCVVTLGAAHNATGIKKKKAGISIARITGDH